jgi:hypothetical protein
MELTATLHSVTVEQAVEGMRAPFARAFGRGPAGRRLARAAWPHFRDALVHGHGMHIARIRALLAAEKANKRLLSVLRWSRQRIERAVEAGAAAAATA